MLSTRKVSGRTTDWIDTPRLVFPASLRQPHQKNSSQSMLPCRSVRGCESSYSNVGQQGSSREQQRADDQIKNVASAYRIYDARIFLGNKRFRALKYSMSAWKAGRLTADDTPNQIKVPARRS
jgi:hypothetical protein